MLFHNWIFLTFFALVYPVYLATRHTRFRTPWLLFASYVFYGWWNWYFLFLILYATVVDYCCVRMMSRWGRHKRLVALSVLNNLSLLGFFKYAAFLTANVNFLLAKVNLSVSLPEPDILLPVGISFFVFQSMSYTIDFYRGKVDEEPNLLRYATFVALFPQLVAGPIERARNLLPQLRKPLPIGLDDVSSGMSLFLTGLFKKVALADFLAVYVEEVYSVPELYDSPALLLATFAFAWQIYFDFSGYTDMARGVARMMGIRLMLNFNNPYLADSLGDFWQRWHISLSTWFKDYVYIPLGGNQRGTIRTYVNMTLTMLISGVWHGASWTFVIWGALHAFGRIVTRELERTPFYRDYVPRCIKQAVVFLFVCFCWIFFRANSFGDACMIVGRLFTADWTDPRFPLLMGGLVLTIWVYQFLYESRLGAVLSWRPVRIGCAVAMLLYLALFGGSSNQAFIYFQF
jgi:alginate O-acetyltransferase complex protein AlgI